MALSWNDWQLYLENLASVFIAIVSFICLWKQIQDEIVGLIREIIIFALLVAGFYFCIPSNNEYKIRVINALRDLYFALSFYFRHDYRSLAKTPDFFDWESSERLFRVVVCLAASFVLIRISSRVIGAQVAFIMIIKLTRVTELVCVIMNCPRVPVSDRILGLFSEDFYIDQVESLMKSYVASHDIMDVDTAEAKRAQRLFDEVISMFLEAEILFKGNSCLQKINKRDLWEIVVERNDVVNAFTFGWGKCCVYSGLLACIHDDTVLKGVFAHEIAHMVARHVDERVASISSLNYVIWCLKPQIKSLFNWDFSFSDMDLASRILVGVSSLQHSQMNEEEADAIATELLKCKSTGHGVPKIFEILMEMYPSDNSVVTYFSTHPSNNSRLRETSCRIAGYTSKKTTDELLGISEDMLQGLLGMDRFYLGHYSLGFFKLLSNVTIVFGVAWWLLDRWLWNKMANGEGVRCIRSNNKLLLPKSERVIRECISKVNNHDDIIHTVKPKPASPAMRPLSLFHKFVAIFPCTGILGLDRCCIFPSGSFGLFLLKFLCFGVWYLYDVYCVFYPQLYAKVNVYRILAMHPVTGIFGFDRFYRGHYGLGFLKFFTVGGSGVLYFIDALQSLWFDYDKEQASAKPDASGNSLKKDE